jgi:hypothetical protein
MVFFYQFKNRRGYIDVHLHENATPTKRLSDNGNYEIILYLSFYEILNQHAYIYKMISGCEGFSLFFPQFFLNSLTRKL